RHAPARVRGRHAAAAAVGGAERAVRRVIRGGPGRHPFDPALAPRARDLHRSPRRGGGRGCRAAGTVPRRGCRVLQTRSAPPGAQRRRRGLRVLQRLVGREDGRGVHRPQPRGSRAVTAPRPSDDDRPVLVLGPNPTPNGGMHLGHMAGPYLAGDIYARYQRARGRKVVFTTGTDDSQTYVVATARRQGITPEELCRRSTRQIQDALQAMGISIDGFGPFDDTYRATVLDYFRRLHAAGAFRLKTVRLPYCERTGEFMVEGLIEGECPVCLATSRGGLCETCCHPNNFDELIGMHSTIDPADELTIREATILVLPLEEH